APAPWDAMGRTSRLRWSATSRVERLRGVSGSTAAPSVRGCALPGGQHLEVLVERRYTSALSEPSRGGTDSVPRTGHPEPVVDQFSVEDVVLDERRHPLEEV